MPPETLTTTFIEASMADDDKKPDGGMCVGSIARLIEGQIAQTYDSVRMRQAWERILEGPTSRKVIAEALTRELSFGRYVRKVKAQPLHVHLHIAPDGDPEAIGKAMSQALNGQLRPIDM